MPITTIKTDGSLFDPQKIKEDFEAVSNVRVTRIVMSGDGVTDIHYEEIGDVEAFGPSDENECPLCGGERSLNSDGYCSRCW